MHPLKPLTDDLKHSISIAFIIDISIDIIIGALIASLMIELILAKFCPTTIIPPSSLRHPAVIPAKAGTSRRFQPTLE
jgi:hypothetical protein